MIIDNPVGQGLGHPDPVAREILVPIRIVFVRIARQKRIDEVWALLLILNKGVDQENREAARIGACLSKQRHVGRHCAKSRLGGLLIGKIPREIIGGPARPLVHLARLVGAVLDFVRSGQRLDLRLGKARAAPVFEIVEGDQIKRMAIRANLAVDLESALQLSLIETAKRAAEAPFLAGRGGQLVAAWLRCTMRKGSGLPRRNGDARDSREKSSNCEGQENCPTHQYLRSPHAALHGPPLLTRTDSTSPGEAPFWARTAS